MMGIGGILGDIGSRLYSRNDDDIYDRLSHRWTAGILMVFAIIVTTKTYVREDPVTCWCPKEFPGSWESFTNSYCWISNTYYLPIEQDVPRDYTQRRKISPIIYYQWVPIILMFQALLFYLPIVIWRNLNDKTGIDVNAIVETAERYEDAKDPQTRQSAFRYLLKQMHQSLVLHKKLAPQYMTSCRCHDARSCWRWVRSHICCGGQKRFGNYMVMLYFVTKVLFLVNSVGQLFMLNWFLGNDFTMYGIDVIRRWAHHTEWTESKRFPRVTLCDIDIRRLGDVHRYTFQCVLPINLFNERIYLFVWFWFLFLAAVTFFGLFMWALRFMLAFHRVRYITKHLAESGSYSAESRDDKLVLTDFIKEYLQADGFLVVRLVDVNTNKMTMHDFLAGLWDAYRELPRVRKRLSSAAGDTKSNGTSVAPSTEPLVARSADRDGSVDLV